jgi:glutamate-1-semialdehyde 2,1-aminomutase
MLGAAGCILQQDGYLQFLRSLTKELGILLIFDEVVTFRLGTGGLQGVYGIEPDITAFGKIIGGGFPVGAFGGTKDIMKIFSPLEKLHIVQSGTFNANPITMTAGIASLRLLTPQVLASIDSLGDLIRKGIKAAFQRAGIRGTAMGMGSLTHVHFNAEKIVDYRSAIKGNFQAMALVHMKLLEKGINSPPRGGEFSVSSVMSMKDVQQLLSAFEESLFEIKDFIKETTPNLIA